MVNYQRNSLGSRLRGRPKRYLALVSARSHVLKIGAVLAHANQYWQNQQCQVHDHRFHCHRHCISSSSMICFFSLLAALLCQFATLCLLICKMQLVSSNPVWIWCVVSTSSTGQRCFWDGGYNLHRPHITHCHYNTEHVVTTHTLCSDWS